MKITPLQQAIIMYSAELASQMLVIIFTNKVTVASYSMGAFDPDKKDMPFPADGQIIVDHKDKTWIMKWIIEKDANGLGFAIEAIIFDPSKPQPYILGLNGQNLSKPSQDIHRRIGIKFDSEDATETAKGMVVWLFQEIGKIDKEII